MTDAVTSSNSQPPTWRKVVTHAGLAIVVNGAALIIGLLPPGVLQTGRLMPHDWAIAAATAAAATAWLLARSLTIRTALILSSLLAATPAMLLVMTGAQVWPWLSALVLACVVVAAAAAALLVQARASLRAMTGVAVAAALAAGGAMLLLDSERRSDIRVAILSGPLLSPDDDRPGMAGRLARGFGNGPLVVALGRYVTPHQIDALTPAAMNGADAALIIQPRPLAPDELVLLDTWVRAGHQAVLLVDPQLLWEDARSIGDPLRAPRSSEVTPLLTHWGLRLEPSGDGVERRIVAARRMVQVAAAGRLIASGGPCVVDAGALIARCRLGDGMATVIADADLANDGLWTAEPKHPARRRYWTADNVAVIADGLGSSAAPPTAYLVQTDRLPLAVRNGLLVLLILSIVAALTVRRAHSSEVLGNITGKRQKNPD